MLAALPCWQPINPRVLARFDALYKRGPAWTRPGNLVGNGPFTLAEWKPNARIVVTKNPRYWDATRTRLERIEFFPVESEVEERNFRAGQLHVTYALPVSKAASYRRDTPDRLRTDPFLQVTYVQFNCRQPPFDNVKLRRALALGVDRAAIARAVYHDTARPATGLTPPGCGDYGAPVGLASDVEAARRLLAEAGFPGGRGLPAFPLMVFNDSTASRLGEALQAMWSKELGVQTTLELLEQRTLLHNQQAKAYTAVLAGWIGDLADPISFLGFSAADSENNFTGWSNPEYDRLLREASLAADMAARSKFFRQAEALLLAEVPVVPLVNRGKVYLIHPALKGWEPAPLGLRRYQHLRLER
jgi:oligopeptide transport system substrate-binding protein